MEIVKVEVKINKSNRSQTRSQRLEGLMLIFSISAGVVFAKFSLALLFSVCNGL